MGRAPVCQVMKPASKPSTLRIRTSVRAGGIWENHNKALRIRTSVRAGGNWSNHNKVLCVRTPVATPSPCTSER